MESSDQKPDWKKDITVILKSRVAKIVGTVLLLSVLLRVGVNWWMERSTGAAVRIVKVSEVSLRTIDKTLNLPGNVEAIEEATLYSHVSGYLKKILVDEGDKVKKNQLLAVIDAPDIVQEYRNAKAEFDFKETTRKRYDELLKEKVVSQQEYDKVNADANQAKARFDNADANVQYTSVRAPFSGSIARRFRYPGDFISAPTKGGPPSPIFLLVNEERLRIAINVPQKEVGSISIGHSVDIRVDTFPAEKFTGTISRVDALLDEATKTQRALIDVDNPDTRLRAGMFASAVLHVEHKDNVPMVSKDAVHEDGDKTFVFVVREGKAKKVPVTTGDSEGGFVEVNSPTLEQKDQVIISGGQALLDNDAVKISSDSGRTSQQIDESTQIAGQNRK